MRCALEIPNFLILSFAQLGLLCMPGRVERKRHHKYWVVSSLAIVVLGVTTEGNSLFWFRDCTLLCLDAWFEQGPQWSFFLIGGGPLKLNHWTLRLYLYHRRKFGLNFLNFLLHHSWFRTLGLLFRGLQSWTLWNIYYSLQPLTFGFLYHNSLLSWTNGFRSGWFELHLDDFDLRLLDLKRYSKDGRSLKYFFTFTGNSPRFNRSHSLRIGRCWPLLLLQWLIRQYFLMQLTFLPRLMGLFWFLCQYLHGQQVEFHIS